MKLSVVIPSYRRPTELERCLRALARQERCADEVIVVHRDDDVATALTIADSGLSRVCAVSVACPGVLAAMQAGLDHASGDVVAFTDDDAAPHEDWLVRIEAVLQGDARVAGVGGRDFCWYGQRLVQEGRSRRVGRVQWFGRLTGGHHAGSGPPQDVHVLKGCNMAFRRRVLSDIGFDDRLRGQGAQPHFELSICLEALRRGWTLRYDPAIAVDHFPAERHDDDQRNAPRLQAVTDGAHNETVALVGHLIGLRRAGFYFWATMVGTRAVPGLLQAGRRRACGDRQAWAVFVAVLRGRWTGRRAGLPTSDGEPGHDLSVIAHSPSGRERAALLFEGQKSRIVVGGRTWAGAVRALREVFRRGVRTVYLIDIGASTTLSAIAARCLGRRVIVDTGDLGFDLARSVGRRGAAALAVVWIGERLTQHMAHHLVVRGHRHLEHLSGTPASVIRDLPPREARPIDGGPMRRRLRLEDSFVVGLVGSLNFAPRLGVGYGWDLVEALALTESVVVGLVVGDGPGRARLEHRAAQLGVRERIHFLGRLDAAETVSAIAAMDVAISTQSNDSVGQVRTTGKLPLYLACACPVLASHVGEAASLLGPLGWTIRYEGTVDRDYPARLAARIALWRDQGAQQADRRRAALELADSAFDLDHARQRVYATLTAHNSQNGDDMDRPARRLSLAQRRGLIDRLRVRRLPTLLATAWKLSPSFKDALRMWALLARGFLEPHMPFLRTGSVRSVSVATNCGTRTVYLRENGSDLFTFYEIFIKRVYEGALPLRQGAVVVDLGANIGMTALWLATQADAVRVIAVEPEASNFEMLQRNVADDDVTVVHAAIADAPGQVLLELSSPSGHHITDGSDALLSRGNGQVVVAIHPDDLVSQFGLDEVDFLKVDIEGAEEAVFSKPSELAGRAELILMEIHNVDARETIGRAFKAQGLKTLDRRGAEALDGFARLHPSV